MMFDKIETISKSVVQHGPNNDRAYLKEIHPEENVEKLIEQLDVLAIMKRYGKIFAVIPEHLMDPFLENDYKLEATVPGFYNGNESGCFLGKYFNVRRGYLTKKQEKLIKEVKEFSLQAQDESEFILPKDCELAILSEKDIPEIVKVYKQVFKFYPFPIFKESYLLKSMRGNAQYFGVYCNDKLVAVSATETDLDSGNAEMTDFATLPGYRGQNLSYFLLERMLQSMRQEGVKTTFTIARSLSYGMNKTFSRLGFELGGTLIKNTLIGKSIESMNVWYKHLDAAE